MDAHEKHQTQREEEHESHGKGEHEGHELVTITVDDKPVEVHRGRQSVAAIKAAGGIAQGCVLVQVIDQRDVSLADDAYVIIHGGEAFESQPPDGASS